MRYRDLPKVVRLRIPVTSRVATTMTTSPVDSRPFSATASVENVAARLLGGEPLVHSRVKPAITKSVDSVTMNDGILATTVSSPFTRPIPAQTASARRIVGASRLLWPPIQVESMTEVRDTVEPTERAISPASRTNDIPRASRTLGVALLTTEFRSKVVRDRGYRTAPRPKMTSATT